MLSGAQSFFKKRVLTRFEKIAISSSISSLLVELEAKLHELDAAANQKEPDYIAKQKYPILLKFFNTYKNIINVFNNDPVMQDEIDEKNIILQLTKMLKLQAALTLVEGQDILLTPRGAGRLGANCAIHLGFLLASLGISVVGSFTFFGAVAAIYGANLTSGLFRKASGIGNIIPRSAMIIIELLTTLSDFEVVLIKELKDRNSLLTFIPPSAETYALLGLSVACDEEQLKHAYKKIVSAAHPDHYGNGSSTHERFVALNDAYLLIKQYMKTKAFDQTFLSIKLTRNIFNTNLNNSNNDNLNIESRRVLTYK